MQDVVYLGIILIVAAYSAINGFRKGLTKQLANLLGAGFGAVAARVLAPGWSHSFQDIARMMNHGQFPAFTSEVVCAVCIYGFVYFLFAIFAGVLHSAMAVFQTGMFNRLLGMFFCIFKNLMWVSVGYTLLLCFNPDNGLVKYAGRYDGNIVEGVMQICPALLGCPGAEDLSHLLQLREAAKISCNFNPPLLVIKENACAKYELFYVENKRAEGRDRWQGNT